MPLPERPTACLLRWTLRLLLKPALSPRWRVPAQRRWLEQLSAIVKLPRGMARHAETLGGVPSVRWSEPDAPPVRAGAVLYLHGGGFTVGSPRTHRALAAWLARETGVPVHLADYRLAPEHPFPAALDDALAAYDALCAQGPVLVAGDSAGGNLALGLAIAARDSGRPAPAGVVLISPAVDLRESALPTPVPGEAYLTPSWLRENVRHYAEGRAEDPRVSPLLADLHGLPPVRLQSGTDDLLFAQSQALARALQAAGNALEFEPVPDRWHVFQLHAGLLPGANAAVRRLADFVRRRLDATPAATVEREFDTLVLGAGMSGLCAALQLQREGRRDYVMVEQSEGIGGTWWDNRYPGAQVDVPAPAYAFSFAPNPRWRQRFADAHEIQAYQQRLAESQSLFARLRLGTRLQRAEFDAGRGRWRFTTADGEVWHARFFLCSTGPLSQPRWPDIPGLDRFRGDRLHSARWPAQAVLSGRRVAVIGTGSTAVQLVPPIARIAARLHVFQRSANWVLPRMERRYGALDPLWARLPPLAALVRAGWVAFLDLGRRGFEDGTLMRRLMLALAARHRRRQVPDPALRAALTPAYPLGCRRIIYSDDYYPALQRPNVELVTAPILRFTATGLVTADGVERPIDAVVCATGFDTVQLLSSLCITGRDGRTLAEAWRDGPEAWLGTAVAGFPNLFLMLGPNTATGHTSTLLYIEPTVRHALRCLRAARAAGPRAAIEVPAEAMQAFNTRLQQRLQGSVWAGCSSWYRSEAGKVVAIWPGYTREFVRALEAQGPVGYRLG